jgi:hypothetical protein
MKSGVFLVCWIFLLTLLCTPARLLAEGWDEVFEQPRAFEVTQGINYRSGPHKNNEVLGVLKQGERLTVFGLEKGWYKFQKADGTTGYVFKKFLQPTTGDAPAPGLPTAPGQPLQPDQTAPVAPTTPGALPATGMQPPAASPAGADAASDCAKLVIKQDAGTTSATAVIAGGVQDCYVLPVAQSKWVEVWLLSTEGKASFDIFTPVGAVVISGETHWLGRTDVAGNYIILVAGKAAKTEYTVKVQVR